MIPLSSFLSSFNNIQSRTYTKEELSIASEFFITKFLETSQMFKKFDREVFQTFATQSQIKEFGDSELVFKKEEDCNDYYFILMGDLNFYQEENPSESNRLIKTISAGTIYGHKLENKLRFYARARGSLTLLLIDKKQFDTLINEYNDKRSQFKLNFLKKFFPHLRLYSDDIIKNMLQFFIREKFHMEDKLFVYGEFDEYVYVIINGEVGVGKKASRLWQPSVISGNDDNSNLITAININEYIIIEKFKRGDLFGGYSALKYHKCNYTAIGLTPEAEVYKISKSHILYYFGGNSGFIPKSLKAIDTMQQVSHQMKIEFIQKNKSLSSNELTHIEIGKTNPLNQTKIIDETKVENVLFEAWKSLKDLDSKVSAFKTSLLKGETNQKQVDIFSKLNETSEKDYTKISGDATNRVVGRKLQNGLNNTQLKAINSLNSFCGIKKAGDEELSKLVEISNKMEGNKNRLTSFDINSVNDGVKANTSNQIGNTGNQTTTTTIGTDKIKQNEGDDKIKSKRPKFSLKNLI